MLNSVLLHLERAPQAEAVIRLGVAVACRAEARLRGLTLVDTRRVESALACEAALYAVVEQTRAASAQRQQEAVREILSRACLQAGLNFDVRRDAGDPLRVLPREARFHDLVITSLERDAQRRPAAGGLSPHDLVTLLDRGAQPLLVVQGEQRAIERVLLVYDGSEASGRAIRSFLGLGILARSEHRLLAIGRDELEAQAALREMADYCLARRAALETGYCAGRVRRVLSAYARKWQADLVVWGVGRGNRLWRRLLGDPALDLWRNLDCGLFITT